MNEVQKIAVLTESELDALVKRAIGEALKAKQDGHGALELLDLKQAAGRLSLPKSRITQAVKEGNLAYVKVGHYLRFRPLDLQDFITRCAEKRD